MRSAGRATRRTNQRHVRPTMEKMKPTMVIPIPIPAHGNSLPKHTKLVVEATDALTAALVLDDKYKATLHTAALWHDVGKAHEEFQKALRDGEHQPPMPTHFTQNRRIVPNHTTRPSLIAASATNLRPPSLGCWKARPMRRTRPRCLPHRGTPRQSPPLHPLVAR